MCIRDRFQTAGSNANDILTAAEGVMERASKNFPKGIEYFNMYSAKEFLDSSIGQVEETLLIAFVLVFLVVFIFLQDFRATLIPAIAVPVSYTHLRAHETPEHLVCRLLLEKKKK